MFEKDKFKLSIIIPCFNEKNTIEVILKKIKESLKYHKIIEYEIIIVDDFSNDGTTEVLKNLIDKEKMKIYFHNINLGKGAAIHTALKNITGDITIIQDADLEYDPFDYNKLLVPFFEKLYEMKITKKIKNVLFDKSFEIKKFNNKIKINSKNKCIANL